MTERNRKSLNGFWKLSFTPPEGMERVVTTAPVPGNVEPILVKLGLVEDYMPPDDLFCMEPFDYVDDWTYETSFQGVDFPDADLVFSGIDTLGEIYLNGVFLGNTRNMHRTYRFPVASLLKPGENHLKVIIRSAVLYAREHPHNEFIRTNRRVSEYDSCIMLRKARHQWGWDNAPRLLTSGIIGDVYLQSPITQGFSETYFRTLHVDGDQVRIAASWIYRTPVKSLRHHRIRLFLMDGDRVVYSEEKPVFHTQGMNHFYLPRKDLELWWPAGYGEPKLYTIKLEMLEHGEVVDTAEAPMGIRTIRLEYSDVIEEDGSGEFVFRVNGEKIMIRGTNWKPLDPLASIAHQKTAEEKALRAATDLSCNMIRIWGGGIYEREAFFDYCDRHGIMVWQDFMFGCEVTPIEDDYCQEAELEAIEIVKRLRSHASLAVFCGDNENDMFFRGYNRHTQSLPSEQRLSREVLKRVVHSYAPSISYVPSSPYVSDRSMQTGLSTPEEHVYPNARSFSRSLRSRNCRFIGETGPISVNAISPDPALLERERARVERLYDAPWVTFGDMHQDDHYFLNWRKAGRELCLHCYGRDFALAEWKDYVIAVNLACAEIFKDVIEYSRVCRWNKTGVLWWSLTDMWPMLFNYSVSDYNQNPKLPYYWIKASQIPVGMMVCRCEIDGPMKLYLANENAFEKEAVYCLEQVDRNGNGTVLLEGICRGAGNSTSMVAAVAEPCEPALLLLRYWVDGKQQTNHFFTGPTDYETRKAWLEILASQRGYGIAFAELA